MSIFKKTKIEHYKRKKSITTIPKTRIHISGKTKTLTMTVINGNINTAKFVIRKGERLKYVTKIKPITSTADLYTDFGDIEIPKFYSPTILFENGNFNIPMLGIEKEIIHKSHTAKQKIPVYDMSISKQKLWRRIKRESLFEKINDTAVAIQKIVEITTIQKTHAKNIIKTYADKPILRNEKKHEDTNCMYYPSSRQNMNVKFQKTYVPQWQISKNCYYHGIVTGSIHHI